jgi:hypothetical protein
LDKNRISSDQITQFKNFHSFHQKATQKQKTIQKKTQILFSYWGNETKDKNPFFDFEAVTFFFASNRKKN